MAPVHNEITNRWEELDEEMKEDFGEEFFQTCEAIIVLGVHFAWCLLLSETRVNCSGWYYLGQKPYFTKICNFVPQDHSFLKVMI